jgi:hypothetical protein
MRSFIATRAGDTFAVHPRLMAGAYFTITTVVVVTTITPPAMRMTFFQSIPPLTSFASFFRATSAQYSSPSLALSARAAARAALAADLASVMVSGE